MRYILHYTSPGDIVFDGFCGTGMAGIAAQLCGSRAAVESLGFELDKRGGIYTSPRNQAENQQPFSVVGHRFAVLNDLSPIAGFIAANYNQRFPVDLFRSAARAALDSLKEEIGWMYATRHPGAKSPGVIDYTVWSEVFTCPECGKEIVFSKEAFDEDTEGVKESFKCPHCSSEVTKAQLDLLYDSHLDRVIGKTHKLPRRKPVAIHYTHNGKKFSKKPDDDDLKTIEKIASMPLPPEVPTVPLPDMQMARVGRMQPANIKNIHHFFLPRQAQALGLLWRHARKVEDLRLRNAMLFFVEQAIWGMSVLNRYSPSHFSQVNRALSGVFYVASQISEVSPWYNLEGKLSRLCKAFEPLPLPFGKSVITTGDLAHSGLPDASIDYVFTDPPFGENIYYSDLNVLLESWHGVRTNPKREAIVDRARGKSLYDYQLLMERCFGEYYRVLKPGRWITIEFHNSKNSVWNAIQEALQRVGFVVADVRTLDKKQGSFQQVVSGGAVKQDLVISAYRPTSELERRFKLEAGTEEGVWDFVRNHLRQLPVFVSKDGDGEPVAERQAYLLFDRMVAFHVQRGVSVPMSSSEFYGGLQQRLVEREAMYFLPEQAADFDRQRMGVSKLRQLQLFVTDESSAIQWIRQQLNDKPQSFKELQPQFMKEVAGWDKHEQPLELLEILRQNFICYDGNGQVPNPIHAYLSSNFKELRNLPKTNATLRDKAHDRWYVPDPNKAGDLEKLRERTLLAEFDEYKSSKQRTLKIFRTEAVRVGFKAAYDRQDYKTIVEVASKVPETVLQEDEKLLMYYDVATTRLGDGDRDKLFK
jgi:16S rRNA G966 N2-methylase RsmD/DNA-directed RNA polymerase subunit RPC12/RpoP